MRACAIAVLTLSLYAVAASDVRGQNAVPQPSRSQQQLDIAAARAERKAIVGQNMYLTDAQAKSFWPLYDSYEARMDRIEDRHIREIKTYVASYKGLTDASANQKLTEVLEIQQARLQTQREYVSRFRAVLPGVLVTRFFQIDNKMRAMVQCNIAQMIPLAQSPSPNAGGRTEP
ncbi:MAG: hypothetical protein JO166_18140 [Deltaproteobacteria bacterium]|nr:hypothetical protein [Deltaproteobacteria bacterium]